MAQDEQIDRFGRDLREFLAKLEHHQQHDEQAFREIADRHGEIAQAQKEQSVELGRVGERIGAIETRVQQLDGKIDALQRSASDAGSAIMVLWRLVGRFVRRFLGG